MTNATKTNEIDYTSFYFPTVDVKEDKPKQQFEKKESDPTRKGQVLSVTNPHNLGTTFIGVLPDTVLTEVTPGQSGLPRLYRKISKGIEGYVRNPENDKLSLQYQLPQSKDFLCKLTTEQSKLIDHLRDQANNFANFTDFTNRKNFPEINAMVSVKKPGQLVYMYGLYLKHVSKEFGELESPEIGQVRCFKFDKGAVGQSDIITALNASIASKVTALKSTKWMKDYFSRSVGTRDRVLSVTVDRSTEGIKKYIITTTFEEVAPYIITEDDLAVADNLNTRVFNIEEFNEEYYHNISLAFDKVQGFIDSMSK